MKPFYTTDWTNICIVCYWYYLDCILKFNSWQLFNPIHYIPFYQSHMTLSRWISSDMSYCHFLHYSKQTVIMWDMLELNKCWVDWTSASHQPICFVKKQHRPNNRHKSFVTFVSACRCSSWTVRISLLFLKMKGKSLPLSCFCLFNVVCSTTSR